MSRLLTRPSYSTAISLVFALILLATLWHFVRAIPSGMARVPESERWEIIELYFKGRSQRKIAEATGRTLKTVNRIVRAFKSCRRIKDAPRKPRSRVTTEQEDAWIVAAAAVKLGLCSANQKYLRLESIRYNGQATPPESGSEEQDCSPKASSSRSEQRKTAAVFSTACATFN
ncbi:hypothetical protein MRX96_018889 [Rhipicephalus microplus]